LEKPMNSCLKPNKPEETQSKNKILNDETY
jgi:hypothetical protein